MEENVKHGLCTMGTIVGVGATTYFAIKDTIKASENGCSMREKFKEESSAKGKIKLLWRSYGRTMACGAATVLCALCGQISSNKQSSSLAAATASLAALSTQYDKVKTGAKKLLGKETYDELINAPKKAFEEKIKSKTLEAKTDESGTEAPFDTEHVVNKDTEIFEFYEPITKTYFKAAPFQIRDANDLVNRQMYEIGFCSMKEFFGFLRINDVVIPSADDCGWTLSGRAELESAWADIDWEWAPDPMNPESSVAVLEYGNNKPVHNYI